MTLNETKGFLSMLWSLYPNAPKLTAEDKALMAVSWFNLLYEFSLADVWEAAKRCFDIQPRFTPTAPEVRAQCRRTLNVESFLDASYDQLSERTDMSPEAEVNSRNLISAFERRDDLNIHECEALDEAKDHIRRLEELRAKWMKAMTDARTDYDEKTRDVAFIKDGAHLLDASDAEARGLLPSSCG